MKYTVLHSGGSKVDGLVAETLEDALAIRVVGRMHYPSLYKDAVICELREVVVAVSGESA